jgi:hypothetical protein
MSRSFGFGFVENVARQFLTEIESFHVSFPLTALAIPGRSLSGGTADG